MITFAKPTLAPAPRTKDVKRIAIFYAVLLVIMAVSQLFTYEDFTALFASFEFPGGEPFAYFSAALMVAAEVFALPFLLGMPLSRAFRWVSMVSGWIVAAGWLKVSIWLVVTEPAVDTVGFLGTVANTMPGWWAVFISISLAILAAWASWGMWPRRVNAKK